MYLFRDRHGIRPYIIFLKNHLVLFGSEIKSLVKVLGERPSVFKILYQIPLLFGQILGVKHLLKIILKFYQVIIL